MALPVRETHHHPQPLFGHRNVHGVTPEPARVDVLQIVRVEQDCVELALAPISPVYSEQYYP
jgi:hypothetical protein